jgi:hypothetical protein
MPLAFAALPVCDAETSQLENDEAAMESTSHLSLPLPACYRMEITAAHALYRPRPVVSTGTYSSRALTAKTFV